MHFVSRFTRVVLMVALSSAIDGFTAEWLAGPGHRRLPLEVRGRPQPGFTKLDAAGLGIDFTNRLSRERSILNRNLLNGSGVAAGDVDGDGRCDLYFCGLESANALYRNLGGWRFEKVSAGSPVECAGQDSTGAVFADVDQDGDRDLLVAALNRGVRLFLNDGSGQFAEATAGSGLDGELGSTSMALADADGDGDLDLYVAHYRPDTIADRPTTTYRVQVIDGWPVVVQVNGQPANAPPWADRFEVSPLGKVLERGLPDHLYLNEGHGRFRSVPFTGGAFLDEDGSPLRETPRDWGLSVQWRDLNGDGAPDLYICNDFVSSDRVWINLNDGRGRFRALPRHALRTICASSMGVDGADLDRDGDIDLFVVDMLSPDHRKRHVQLGERLGMRAPEGLVYDRLQVSRNTLLLNRGDGTYAEIAYHAGLEAADWAWMPAFLDVDLDGFEDVLAVNGVLRDFQNVDAAERMEAARGGRPLTQKEIVDAIGRFPTLETPNLAWRNRGDRTFEDSSAAWGFDAPGISQGMALADLDDDGDMDVVMNNLLDGPGVFRNEGKAPRIAVRLRGEAGNPDGVGAFITVHGGPVVQSQEMLCGGRYLSGDQAQRTFAVGTSKAPLRIEVAWRSGRRSVVEAVPGSLYEIAEPGGDAPRRGDVVPRPGRPEVRPWFETFAGFPEVKHEDPPFDESARQPMLLRRLDRPGPGVAWHDLDRDGQEDLLAGNGRGGLPLVFLNRGGTNFVRHTNAPFSRPLARDLTTVLGAKDTVLAGSTSWEDGGTNGGLLRLHDFTRRVAGETLSGYEFACGPLSMADVDGDGDLDLFIGGRAIPGRYPEAADSILFRNDAGRFVEGQRFEKLGVVSGATFSDLDGDGTPELLLAAEWSPIRVFRREAGRYREMTEAWGLASWRGWWAGVATGDFDGDGRLEILASNWGLNTSVRASRAHPRRIHFGDLDESGTVDLIEARFLPSLAKEVPDLTLNWARTAVPSLMGRIPDFATYGRSSVDEIYGEALAGVPVLEVDWLATTLFRRNQDGRFEAVALPAEAQFAPAFGVAISDFDGDGNEDAFLAQNFSALGSGEPRPNPEPGLGLRGDGHGGLKALSPAESGVRLDGDQRACAFGDFDRDGRVDLAVGQNSDLLRVFRNVGARPGLRIRLRGSEGNPDGVGAQIRLRAKGETGPVREVQSGSGYWSQNSAVQVMSLRESLVPETVWVRWPGGRETTTRIPPGAREIVVDASAPGP